MRSRWRAPLALLLVTTSACAASAQADSPPPLPNLSPSTAAKVTGTSAPVTAPPSTAPSTTTAPTTTAPAPITIAFAGDVHGEQPIRSVLDQGGNPLAGMQPVLSAADLAVVNLETVVGVKGAKVDKQYNFRAPVSLLTAVHDAGVDVVSLANNHSFDFGTDALLETLDNAHAAQLATVGAGDNAAAAWNPAVFDVRGVKVAVVGIARVGPPAGGLATATHPGTTNGQDIAASVRAVQAAKRDADIVVVITHMGEEGDTCPRLAERQFVDKLLAAGASAVVGAHPHVLQGVTLRDGKLAAYSVGNFVFYATKDDTRRTGVLTVTIDPATAAVTGYTWDPAYIDVHGQPQPLSGPARQAAIDDLAALTPGGPRCR